MNPKFKIGIIASILVVLAIALFDIFAAYSGVFGTYENYTNGQFDPGWWNLFFKFNLILILVIPISYYFFARKDISESIALFINSYILWFFGLADLFYFVLQGKGIPETLTWLNGHPVIGKISLLLGSNDVSRIGLLTSIALAFVFIFVIDKFMEKIN